MYYTGINIFILFLIHSKGGVSIFELYELRQLITFAETGTLSEAAEILHLSQPALSRNMKKLEEDLGLTLFERTKNKLSLNKNGKYVLELAKKLLEDADSLAEKACPSLPCFVTDVSENHRVTLANRISIPISDPEATVTYYLIMLLCEDSIFYTSGRISGQSGSFICIKSIHCFDQPDGPGRKQILCIIVRTLILFYHMGYQTHVVFDQHISGGLVAFFAAFQIQLFFSVG